ncbi:acyltransferase family protein [Saccharothrix sp. Mg75]|uniref:acyltransferase family protein n=1 Tax=Saccharothrix sp. Mg75 TaxID=3445357 RepID=UPI003EEF00E4
MSAVVEQRATAAPAGDGRKFRADIQALRAIAVSAVVVNHLWPHSLTGGYVGVDVFFVISGFLISSHLAREIDTTGRVRLGRFYARRVRRLLPAAFLVLGVSLVAAYLLLPYPRWKATATEAFASATYWENWLLAAKSVDYSASSAAASLVQHYWSLSVEEQFYLVWPLLMVLLFAIRRRTAQVVGVAAVSAASLAFSVYYTQVEPNQAYFVTPVRVWEFGLGALVALTAVRLPARVVEAASFAGLALIAWSAFAFDHDTQFPGYLALVPTVGTVLVIASEGSRWHRPVTASAPVQFLGGISYSLYLWHWPLIMIAPFALSGVLAGDKPGTLHLLGVLAVAVLLSWLTKLLVEDRGIRITRSTGLSFTGMVAGMLVVSAAAYGLNWTYDRHVAQAERDVAATPVVGPCVGGSALLPENGCRDPLGPARNVLMGPANEYWKKPSDCVAAERHRVPQDDVVVCDFSDGAESPQVVWLVGDSHAQHWQPPVADLARERGWVLKYVYVGGCPFAQVRFKDYQGPVTPDRAASCADWNERTTRTIVGDAPDVVLTSFFSRREKVDDGTGRSEVEQYRDGLEPRWERFTEVGARVVVLGDPPLNGEVRDPNCVVLNQGDPTACAVDRTTAQPPDPLAEVARTSPNPDVSLVDLTEHFCDADRCYAAVGGLAVYYDADHMNSEFSRSLAPVLGRAIDAG